MTIYQVMVKLQPVDGWGRDLPIRNHFLNSFRVKDDAEEYIKNRSTDKWLVMYDIGQPWIEKIEVVD